ncbi:MAG: membrane protein insertion efficiency factor YidD [Eubacterium sp.]|nr:membrane protein insertion efficiency factor YidD [Eubacterium sp.]MDE6863499.1 membrane protein insertion efficiency factor YidD [Eubacterium sp.]
MKKILIFLIKTYQMTISPRFSHGCCRFNPTCSQYAIEAIEIHGIFKGSLLAAWRILRCNPFSKGGWDPVPPKITKKDKE